MSGAESNGDGATTAAAAATVASATPSHASAPLHAAAIAASNGRPALALAPFAAASAKEAELYYHCDEWFLRADTRAAAQSFFRSQVEAQLSEDAADLLLCFLQRLTRWVLIRTRTFSLGQSESDDHDSGWGSHNHFGGEGEEEVRVHDGRRPHIEWWLKRLCPRFFFGDLLAHARDFMDKFKGSSLEGHPNLSCVTMWSTLPGSAASNDRPVHSLYPRGDRLPAQSQLFLGCALDYVTDTVAEKAEMAFKSVNVHGHTHGRHYATDQHPHALEFQAESAGEDGYFQCAICQSYGDANLYHCSSDTCAFDVHARCFIPRAEGGGQSGESSGNGGASAVDGEPERKRQRADEMGASVDHAVASASSSSAAVSAQAAAGSSSAAAAPVWTAADLRAGLLEGVVRMLSERLGMLRDLGHMTREGEDEATNPPQWEWPTEEPYAWLWPQALEAPFEVTPEKPLLSSSLANIRDLLQRYAWFHDPAQIAEVKRRFLSGALVGGHPLWQHRRHIRPVAFYGRSWKPRWTMPDACIAEKVAFHELPLKEQEAIEAEEGEDDPFGKTSSFGDYSFDTIAFDLIDGAGREWPLLLEYRECTYVGDVEAFNASGTLIDRRTFRTLGLIRSDEEASAALTLQPADAVPFFRHWTLLDEAALAEATGDECGDLDPEGTLRPHTGGTDNGEELWPDQWLALLHPALSQQQSASAAGSAAAASSGSSSRSPGSAAQSDSADSTAAGAIAAIRLHAAQVHTQIQRLVCAAATLTEWKPKELSMFRAFQPPRVVREFTTVALLQRMGADDSPVAASADRAAAAATAPNDVSGSCSSASAAPSVTHPFAQLPRDLWDLVSDYAPLDLPFVALDPSRPVGAASPAAGPASTAAAAGAGSVKSSDDDDGAFAGEFVGADGRLHALLAELRSYGSLSSLFW